MRQGQGRYFCSGPVLLDPQQLVETIQMVSFSLHMTRKERNAMELSKKHTCELYRIVPKDPGMS